MVCNGIKMSYFCTVLDRSVICSLSSVAGNSTASAVILKTTEKSVWTNEFDCKSYMKLFRKITSGGK